MRRPKKEIQLTSYDELLGLEETPEKSMNQVVEIDLAKLYPFKNHPFQGRAVQEAVVVRTERVAARRGCGDCRTRWRDQVDAVPPR